MGSHRGEREQLALIRPKYYAAENVLVATGYTDSYFLTAAKRLGVHVHYPNGGRKWIVDADEFDAALKRDTDDAERQARSLSPEPVDEAEALRRQLGLRKVRP